MKKLFPDCSLILMVFIFLNHLLVMASFIIGNWFLPYTLPASFLTSALLYFFFEKGENVSERIRNIAVSVSIIIVSFILSAFYFDLSWDGQWYQQSAVYHIEDGWNPFAEPIRTFEANNDLSILHFPKGSWYFAASVFSFLGNFEAGKSLNFILVATTVFLYTSVLQDFGLSKFKSAIMALLVTINPVVWSEITTYLVDGSLILYMSIYILMIFAFLKHPGYKHFLIGSLAITGMINLKFTGLVFFCTFALFASIYVLVKKREYFIKFIGVHAVVFLLSVTVFGYNPYVTNLTQRGHPFYPIFGTNEFPSIFEQSGQDDNEVYETPVNMQGKPLLARMFYANFGRPDNAPYYKAKEAELIWPFTSGPSDWQAYNFHETRVSGFGPYFSGVLILSFILAVIIFLMDKNIRWIMCLTLTAIFCSLLFSRHLWWPRFGPQMWLIPVIPVCFYFLRPVSRLFSRYAWAITAIILINGIIVLLTHISWETRSSIKLRKQLTEIQERKKPIEIFIGYFRKSMEEKLDRWQIVYEAVSPGVLMEGEHIVLTSVVEGYPNMVMYREKNEEYNQDPEGQIFRNSGQSLGNYFSWNVQLGDLDNDGDLDAVVANPAYQNISSNIRIWINNGAGIFTEGDQIQGSCYGITLFDIDNDKNLDIIEGAGNNTYKSDIRIWLNNGDADFFLSDEYLFRGEFILFDSNLQDSGRIMAVTLEASGNSENESTIIRLYSVEQRQCIVENEIALKNYTGTGIASGDLNNDGYSDLVICSDKSNYLMFNDQKYGFIKSSQELAGSFNTSAVYLDDLNGDKSPDILQCNYHDRETGEIFPAKLYLNDGKGNFNKSAFNYRTEFITPNAAITDIDNDGDPDIYLNHGHQWKEISNKSEILFNDGYANFTAVTVGIGPVQSRSIAFGDLDRDGDQDLFQACADLETIGLPNMIWINIIQDN